MNALVAALAPFAFLLVVYTVVRGGTSSGSQMRQGRSRVRASDVVGAERPGLLLTALAVGEFSWASQMPHAGLLAVPPLALGLAKFPKATMSIAGVLGSIAVLDDLRAPGCAPDGGQTTRLIVAVFILMLALGAAALRWLAPWIDARRSRGLLALSVFAELSMLNHALRPGGFSIASLPIAESDLAILIVLVAVITTGLAITPAFTARMLGVGLFVVDIILDTVAGVCGASPGALLLFVTTTVIAVSLLRRGGMLT